MNPSAMVTNIQKFSVHDGPGIRSLIFTKGCPLRCLWCANPENIHFGPELMLFPDKCIGCKRCADVCPQNAITIARNTDGKECIQFDRKLCIRCGACAKVCFSQSRVLKGEVLSCEQVEEKVDKDLPFYKNSGGGITFSGGEPLLHPQFIARIAKYYREKELSTAVETCGFVPWENFEIALPWIDWFLFDIKFIDSRKHEKYCGRGNQPILENLQKLSRDGRCHIIVRIPIIPGINDEKSDLALVGAFLGKRKDRLAGVHILPYHNYGSSKYDALGIPYQLSDLESPTDEYMQQIRGTLEQYGLKVQIGG